MKTVAIIHGWSGGPQHTKHFVNVLKQSGFAEIRDARKADVIFAHSAGVYAIPEDNRGELIVLHGPPYWPGRNILQRTFGHIGQDASRGIKHRGYRYFFRKKFWEVFYVLRYPHMTLVALRNHRSLDFLDRLQAKKVLVIRNQDDQFCSPTIKDKLLKFKNLVYEELPGHHDDFYVEPEPYIELIKKHL